LSGDSPTECTSLPVWSDSKTKARPAWEEVAIPAKSMLHNREGKLSQPEEQMEDHESGDSQPRTNVTESNSKESVDES
jgi:hypothetical protein